MLQPFNLPCPELRVRYESGQTTTELASHYGCSPTTIAKYLRDCGVELRSSRFQPIEVDEATLRRLYLDERLPIPEIARRLGISVSTVSNKRRLYRIPVRSRR